MFLLYFNICKIFFFCILLKIFLIIYLLLIFSQCEIYSAIIYKFKINIKTYQVLKDDKSSEVNLNI